jgi:outer membrane protein assembly factor BamE (lipoprotein component of BamABCDE complex)
MTKKELSLLLLGLSLVWAGCRQLDELYVESAYSPQTNYSAGFSEEAFDSISIGNDRSSVINRLGEPIREFTEEHILFMVYSDIGHYTRRSE